MLDIFFQEAELSVFWCSRMLVSVFGPLDADVSRACRQVLAGPFSASAHKMELSNSIACTIIDDLNFSTSRY
jgi:hypothetical protein